MDGVARPSAVRMVFESVSPFFFPALLFTKIFFSAPALCSQRSHNAQVPPLADDALPFLTPLFLIED